MFNEKNKIYEHADDVHVRGVLVYIDDTYVYFDEAKTVKIDAETLMALFLKGEVILTKLDESIGSYVYMTPIAGTISNGYAILTYAGGQIYSSEYVSEPETET